MSKMAANVAERWRDAFLACAERSEIREGLREAALHEDLKRWTELLTGVVVASCQAIGWQAAAKGFRLEHLPQANHEYLGLDVTAFEPAAAAGSPWVLPAAVFELENSARDERVAYSVWKVACIRSPFAVVFAYRRDWDAAAALAKTLSEHIPRESSTSGQSIVLALGSRAKGETFPWGFFRFWRFTPTMRGFDRF